MKIAVGADHRGVKLKKEIIDFFIEEKIDYIDYGTNEQEKIDYPIVAEKVAKAVQTQACENGILICGTGVGMSIAANKFKNIRCANVYNLEVAKYSKLHNNANIIALGARTSY